MVAALRADNWVHLESAATLLLVRGNLRLIPSNDGRYELVDRYGRI